MKQRKWIDVLSGWILGAIPTSKDNQINGDTKAKSDENINLAKETEEPSAKLQEQGSCTKETDRERRDTKRPNNGGRDKKEPIKASPEVDKQKTRTKTDLEVKGESENNEANTGKKKSWQEKGTTEEAIITLEISSRTLNALKNAGFSLTSELLGLTRDELLGINGIGPKAATEIGIALSVLKQENGIADKEIVGYTEDRKSSVLIESTKTSLELAYKESWIEEEQAKDKSLTIEVKSDKNSDLSGLENKIRIKMHAKHWLAREGRLPIAEDFDELGTDNTAQKELLGLSLVERIKLLKELREPTSESEWDYHYQAISLGNKSVNEAYWKNEETMAAFVIRASRIKGQEGIVPDPSELPAGAAVVISNNEVKYKEILSGRSLIDVRDLKDRDGEVDDELIQKIVDEAASCFCDHPSDMPSPLQIRNYIDQNPTRTSADINSIISIMSDYGRKDWGNIARMFGKKPQCTAVGGQLCTSYIKYFVKDLGEYLEHLTPSELFVIFESQNLKTEKIEKVSKTFDALVEAVTSGVISKSDLNDWASGYNIEGIDHIVQEAQRSKENPQQEALGKTPFRQPEKENSLTNITESDNAKIDPHILSKLPEINTTQILNALDKAGAFVNSSNSDESRVRFLKSKAKAKLWDACFNDEESISHELRILHRPDNSYSNEVLQSFLEEYDSAKRLAIPSSYEFRDGMGKLVELKLMQKLVALRVLRNKQLLNLSGTGTGKTLSAILSAQICEAKRIIISCPNNVVSSWQRALKAAYPSCKMVIAGDTAWICPKFKDSDTIAYITNHEKFRESLYDKCGNFTADFNPDFIIIDEIHQSKQRVAEEASQRRQCITQFIALSRQLNPNCKVLGMTATPVINNLLEGKSLIELITGEQIDTVTETVDLQSCMALYQSFVENGIRMNLGYLKRTIMNTEHIDITSLLPDVLQAANEGSYIEIEKVLVPPKLETLSKLLCEKPEGVKTIVFIYYIKATLKPIAKRLDSLGIRYGVFTGDDKTANEEGYVDSIDEFINGDTDVLIATIQCAGTGIDGLQAICNRAIFFQLPWTATEFEQSIGRLDRDGTAFDKVQVYIPSTYITLPNSTIWSWCESKMRRINSKRDIARAAVDGEIPDPSAVLTPQEATKYWIGWLERLDAAA